MFVFLSMPIPLCQRNPQQSYYRYAGIMWIAHTHLPDHPWMAKLLLISLDHLWIAKLSISLVSPWMAKLLWISRSDHPQMAKFRIPLCQSCRWQVLWITWDHGWPSCLYHSARDCYEHHSPVCKW